MRILLWMCGRGGGDGRVYFLHSREQGHSQTQYILSEQELIKLNCEIFV
jgi:hypothetical protein